jgi:DNA-binding MarR family transcriptional regulator
MSKSNFISFQTFKDLSTIECLLISWIISLNDAKLNICFSNEYAAKRLKTSTATITRAIARLKRLGYIKTFQPSGDKRFIHLINIPELEDLSYQVCELDGVISMITPPNHSDYTPNQNEETSSSQRLDPLITMITNNKEDNKDNNDDAVVSSFDFPFSWEKDKAFKDIINQFPQEKRLGLDEAYDMIWTELTDEEKRRVAFIVPHYLQRNIKTPNFVKRVNNYFKERFWETDEITLSLLKDKTKQIDTTKPTYTNEQIALLFKNKIKNETTN